MWFMIHPVFLKSCLYRSQSHAHLCPPPTGHADRTYKSHPTKAPYFLPTISKETELKASSPHGAGVGHSLSLDTEKRPRPFRGSEISLGQGCSVQSRLTRVKMGLFVLAKCQNNTSLLDSCVVLRFVKVFCPPCL